MSDERIKSIAASNYSVSPFLDYYGTKTRVKFSESCLKQDKVTFNYGINCKYLHFDLHLHLR